MRLTTLAFFSMIGSVGCHADTVVLGDTSADTCADLQSRLHAGLLEAGVRYTGADGFSFEAFDADGGELTQALSTCEAIETSLEGLLTEGAPGALMDYWTPSARITVARGSMDVAAARPMNTATLFRGASVGKTYVSSLAALMAVEGRVDLDNSAGGHALADYLPEVAGKIEYADRITVHQLLNHTSGIPDYFGDTGPAWLEHALDAHARGESISEDDALDLIYGRTANFEPGTSASYCNTGYLLAARIMSRIAGRPYQDELRERILDPLGLEDTYFEKHDAFAHERLAHGYRDAREIGYDFDDWFDVDQGYGFANGGVVTTVRDLTAFFRAIPGGHTPLPGVDFDALLATQRPAADGYNLGLLSEDGCFTHGGNFTGYSTRAFYCPESDAAGALFQNTTADAPEEALTALTTDWHTR